MNLFKKSVKRGTEGSEGAKEVNGRKIGFNGKKSRANVEKFFQIK